MQTFAGKFLETSFCHYCLHEIFEIIGFFPCVLQNCSNVIGGLSGFCISGVSQPYEVSPGAAVDFAHHCDLVIPLLKIALVDADCVDPKSTILVGISHPSKHSLALAATSSIQKLRRKPWLGLRR
jgi:hypothetical protein